MSLPKSDPIVRFWSSIEQTETCWLWKAYRDRDGYGVLTCRPKYMRAHRFAYELLIGPIPEGLQLDHLCRIRHCVNPKHLEPVTSRVNSLRGRTLQAINAAKTHCPQGHPYDAENTRFYAGRRFCHTCMLESDRRQHLKSPKRGLPNAVERRRLQTHCKNGHPFDEANTYRYKNGRVCRICRDARMTRWLAANS